MKKSVALALAGVLLVVAASLATALAFSATTVSLASDKVTICHSTGNGGWEQIEPNVNGVLNGHDGHPNDIIPPFDYEDKGKTQHYPGKNWDATGQGIFANGCSKPQPPTPAPITLCHSLGSNQYQLVSASVEETLDVHDTHNRDIIPPFAYTDSKGNPANYPGQNWDNGGRGIYDNGCVAPPPAQGCPSRAEVTATDSTGQGSRGQYEYPEQVYVRVEHFPTPVPPATSVPYSYTVSFNDQGTTIASGSGSYSGEGFTTLVWDGANAIQGDKGYTVSVTAAGCARQDQFQYRSGTPTPQPKLRVRKVVIGAPGKPASDFSFSVNGGGATAFEADGENELTLAPGTYTVTEAPVAGFTATTDGCSGIVLSAPQQTVPVCTITNAAQTVTPLKLQVQKVVVGSSQPPSDFSFKVNDGTPTPFTADGENELTLPAGTYDVTELPADGFTTTTEGCNGIVLSAPQQTVPVCTITNTSKVVPPTPQAPVGVFVSCVDDLPDGSFVATFGYESLNTIQVTIPIGELNKVTPSDPTTGGIDHGQPSIFEPGSVAAAFHTTGAAGTTIKWSLTSPAQSPGAPPYVDTADATADFATKCSEPPNPPPPTVKVFVTCVENTGSTYSATFGFENDSKTSVSLPIPGQNAFDPEPADRHQPEEFAPGKVDEAVVVTGVANDVDLKWTVDTGNGEPSTATARDDLATKCSVEPPPDPNPGPEPPIPPIPPDPTDRPVGIFAECITRTGPTYTAVFGYQNDNEDSVVIPVGDNNRFVPGGDRGQVTTFLPGNHPNAFSVSGIPSRQLVSWVVTHAGARRFATTYPGMPGCAQGPVPVQPVGIFACVVDHGGTFDAVFGYENDNPVDIPVPIGLGNHFLPHPQDRGQPTIFNPGRHEAAFAVRGVPSGSALAWTVAVVHPTTVVVTAAYSQKCIRPKPRAVAVFPLCVRRTGATYTAMFGYANLNRLSVVLPLGRANFVGPRPIDRGQPTVLRPGIAWFAFSVRKVPIDTRITWTIRHDGVTRRARASVLLGRNCPRTPVDPDASLHVEKSVQPESVFVGERITYRIVVSNPSTTTSQKTVLVDRALDDRVTPLSATSSRGSCRIADGNRVDCLLGTLAPGSSAMVVVVARARAPGVASDRATAVSLPGGLGSDNVDAAAIVISAARTKPQPPFTG